MGVGGSATNDGALLLRSFVMTGLYNVACTSSERVSVAGLGALHALGLRVTVRNEHTGALEQPPVIYGRHLSAIVSLELTQPLLPGASIDVACDVNNPFIGPMGAVAVRLCVARSSSCLLPRCRVLPLSLPLLFACLVAEF